MQIGVVGLGRMGGNIALRLMRAGHHCIVFDTNSKPREALAKDGAKAAGSLAEVVKGLGEKPRAVWVMLPAGKITDETIAQLGSLSSRAISSLMGEIPFTKTTFGAPRTRREANFVYVDAAHPAGYGGSNAAIA